MIMTTIMTGKQFLRFGPAKPATAAALAIIWALANVIPAAAQPSATATVAYGQHDQFNHDTENNGGVSADGLAYPHGATLDGGNNLYVADTNNHRVLFFPAGSTTATRVYGQDGSFTSNTANNGGVTANSLYYPVGVALDRSGNLYVADQGNHRVLYFPAASTTATRVYGQGGSFTSNAPNNGGVTANSLNSPSGAALDSNSNLYMADTGNSRVLFFPAGSTTATRVYGQGGGFTSDSPNNGGISAKSLYAPSGVTLDGSGNLYVADNSNSRVLFFPANSTTATRVYGQNGSFTTNAQNNGGISANSLSYPLGVALDGSGNLYVADYLNNRTLFFPPASTTATHVYGQNGSFTTSTPNNGGISANSLYYPWAVALDTNGVLYVVDNYNNRVLNYGAKMPVTLTPSPLAFGKIVADSTSPAKKLMLKNTGDGTLSISKIALSGDFAISSTTCGSTLSAGKNCIFDVTFTPRALGALTGNLTVTGNISGSLPTGALTGTGTPQATLTPSTETYPSVKVGTTSAAKVFTLANKQSVPLTGIEVSTTGDFSVSSTTCSTSLAATASCQISVVFKPTATGTRTGTLQVSDGTIGGPQISTLTGTGR